MFNTVTPKYSSQYQTYWFFMGEDGNLYNVFKNTCKHSGVEVINYTIEQNFIPLAVQGNINKFLQRLKIKLLDA